MNLGQEDWEGSREYVTAVGISNIVMCGLGMLRTCVNRMEGSVLMG